MTISAGVAVTIGGRELKVKQLLGHGKGGYSFLAEQNGQNLVLKQIHHEPCAYYTFGNKIEAEERDYHRLLRAGIRIPRMLAIDRERELIVKEYVEGPTVLELVIAGQPAEPYFQDVRAMASQARAAGLNIDYFPSNFVVHEGLLYYIDYECNEYMEEWNFENWGIKYWSRTPELEEYLRQKQSEQS